MQYLCLSENYQSILQCIYGPIHFINDHFNINCTVAENYTNISNNMGFIGFEYPRSDLTTSRMIPYYV